MTKQSEAVFVTTLIGNQVKTERGENFGKIEELLIDLSSGQIKSVVLSLGDASGTSSGMSAIPWESLNLTQTEPNRTQGFEHADDESERGKQAEKRREVAGDQIDRGSGKPEPPNEISTYTCSVYQISVRDSGGKIEHEESEVESEKRASRYDCWKQSTRRRPCRHKVNPFSQNKTGLFQGVKGPRSLILEQSNFYCDTRTKMPV